MAGIALVLAPLAVCVAAGSLSASLWLDEILYWQFENSPELRSFEMRRPGSAIAPYFGNFFYADVQRLAHGLSGAFGFGLADGPEIHLRAPALLFFAALAALTYAATFRRSRSWLWSACAGLALASSPLLLFYAFEARVSSLAALGAVAYLLLLVRTLNAPGSRAGWIGGALLGILLGHLHAWVICLYAALISCALLRAAAVRRWRELAVVAAFIVPGASAILAEAAFIHYTQPSGGEHFPLYVVRPWWQLLDATLSGFFSTGSPSPALVAPAWYTPTLVMTAAAVALALLVYNLRRSSESIVPAAAVLALAISVVVGSRFGFMVAPRYQVPLFAALLFSLSLAPAFAARLFVGLVAALNLVLLPNVISDVAAKGNTKPIAALIEAEGHLESAAVVVQHGLGLGYPDPLHNFTLDFYLNETRPGRTPVRILELPWLRDVTGAQGVRGYFGGGPRLVQQYAAIRENDWKAWASNAAFERVWLVRPSRPVESARSQEAAFAAALLAAGFTRATAQTRHFAGYPPSVVSLYVREDARGSEARGGEAHGEEGRGSASRNDRMPGQMTALDTRRAFADAAD